jgi:NADH pyrophosphatase NudC (nudix superfamily)
MVSERVAFTPGITSTATEGRLYVITGQSLCVTYDASRGEPRVPVGPVPRAALYLGELEGAPCFARMLADAEAPPEGTDPIALRQLFGALPDDDFGVAGRALGLTTWDRDHRYCGRCGSPLTYRHDKKADKLDIMTCSLDDVDALPPTFHVWASHKPTWSVPGDGLPVFETTRTQS